MISKERLLRVLRDASDLEEGYMEFLTEFVEKYFDWSGYDHERVATAKKLLGKLRTDSERHNRVVEDIMSWVADRDEDGF